ncbi:formate dehydrogenase subunit delta [Methyloterricola oryzae]|uniref:formate dehydrogenase subunit delta n=1 Tax=Methyloterricola oryzae TaxID=1495050 RepID=UPI0005EB0265|nr:formate dehydrogenase subunit delta [Methyloterricola oryzae]
MHIEKLVKMANDIGAFFQADPDRTVAVHGVVDHIRKFWDPRMRKQIIQHYQNGGEGLSEIAGKAVKQLADDAVSLAESGDG